MFTSHGRLDTSRQTQSQGFVTLFGGEGDAI